MIEKLIEGLFMWYGLDYLSFILNMTGLLFITKKKKLGFLFSATAAVSAFTVALMSQQFGFILANFVSFFIMVRGFVIWNRSDNHIDREKK